MKAHKEESTMNEQPDQPAPRHNFQPHRENPEVCVHGFDVYGVSCEYPRSAHVTDSERASVPAVEAERVCPECGRALQTRSDRKGLVCYRCGYRAEFLGCAKHGFNFRNDCDACQTTEPQTDSRVCQRGVDGSAGCGHDYSWFIGGHCNICEHACDFSPPAVETHDEINDPHPGYDCGGTCVMHSPLTRPFQSAPPHKVASEPLMIVQESGDKGWDEYDFEFATVEEADRAQALLMQSGFLAGRGTSPSLRVTVTPYVSADAAREVLRSGHVRQSDGVAHRAELRTGPLETPPARVWIELRPMPPSDLVGIASYHEDPREHNSGRPAYEYAHLAPIQQRLKACQIVDCKEWDGYVQVLKSDWDALVKSIKGDK